MINHTFDILPVTSQAAYIEQMPDGLQEAFDALSDAEISTDSFSFYTSVSAMASSRIEGEQMEIDSYIRHKMGQAEYVADLTQKPDDLYKAYLFAQNNKLTKSNFLEAHSLLSAHLLSENKRGKCRTGNMVVMEHKTFRIQYEAAPAHLVGRVFDTLWRDIGYLIEKQPISIGEALYFASLIHLVFVNIHPFEDGNGRAARLLEKWFIARILGEKAWFIQSELYYYQHIDDYYRNLNSLGIFYEKLDYSKALPFLLMLPCSLGDNK